VSSDSYNNTEVLISITIVVIAQCCNGTMVISSLSSFFRSSNCNKHRTVANISLPLEMPEAPVRLRRRVSNHKIKPSFATIDK
jgi:hypothetical protein